MATVLGLTMKIAANTAGIAQGAKQTAKQLGNIEESSKKSENALKALVGIEAGKILAGMFVNAAKSALSYANGLRDTIDRTAKLAAQTSISVESLQGFAVAASLGGTDLEIFSSNVKRVTVAVGRLAEAGKTEIFTKIGIDFESFQRLSPEDQFTQLAAAIGGIADPAEKARVAVALFGKAGTEMLPMLTTDFAELQGRLEKLGVILSADQTGAIEQMNDAFTLVQATVDGIIGQITANLAPIVTSLAEDFLGFVESYQGLGGGTGGTAFADSITEALFDGAEYLAGILDWAVAAFNEFGVGLETASAIFEFVANTFTAVAETLRFIFNVFEMIGNALLLGLGKVLEGIGSWVSSDLEQAGKDISAAAYDGMVQNGKEAGDAFVHAANAALGDRNYGRESGGGDGMFSSAVGGARERYENRNSPEAQAAREEKRRKEQEARDAAQIEAEKARKAEEEAKRQAEAQKKYDEQVAKSRDELASKEFQYAMKNAEDLSAVNQKALKGSDIRSGGIDQVLALATGREDPAVVEARKQLRELQVMRASLQALEATPVEIMGAA